MNSKALKRLCNSLYGMCVGTKIVQIKYFSDITPIEKISVGDWIDLRAAETVSYKKGESVLIHLGVGMILPDSYEAIVIPRSSTFNKYHLLMTNSLGIIDNSYSGNDDEWRFQGYATEDGCVCFNDRICQFKLVPNMPDIRFLEVPKLNDINRGGYGTTGIK